MIKDQNSGAFPLYKLMIGETAIINRISAENKNTQRLLTDAGFVPGERVASEYISPLGDPTSYRLGENVVIALRKIDAKNIYVIGDNNEYDTA